MGLFSLHLATNAVWPTTNVQHHRTEPESCVIPYGHLSIPYKHLGGYKQRAHILHYLLAILPAPELSYQTSQRGHLTTAFAEPTDVSSQASFPILSLTNLAWHDIWPIYLSLRLDKTALHFGQHAPVKFGCWHAIYTQLSFTCSSTAFQMPLSCPSIFLSCVQASA